MQDISFSDEAEMLCFMGLLSAEKQIEKTSEQGSLLGWWALLTVSAVLRAYVISPLTQILAVP